MRKRTKKRYKLAYLKATLLVLFCYLLIGKGYVAFEKTGENVFHIQVNGQDVGTLGDQAMASELLLQARRNIAKEEDELVFLEADLTVTGEEMLWGQADPEEQVLQKMEAVLREAVQETLHRSYTVKIGEYMVNLADGGEVQKLLQAAIGKYDTENSFEVRLVHDASREFNFLTTQVVSRQEREETQIKEAEKEEEVFPEGGVEALFTQAIEEAKPQEEMAFEDYPQGLLSVDFTDEVEIVEAYLPKSQLMDLDQAVQEVTAEQETVTTYEVEAGDTLSEISLKVNIPMEQIVAMNDSLEDENTMIHVGDELIITIPEPELSIDWQEERYVEETYDADVIYIENDDWYTNQSVVRQQPSAGFRRAISLTSYVNNREVGKEILKEEVLMEPVAKIVERGTKIPPTYIKPISGGRKTSGFGPRKRPTKGASTYHKGVDWATPVGTTVFASCGGTVVKAGWGSGYGYVVYINHEDGRQTRYGHLSKVLVKVGQKVKQGEKIALSGNTGVTTGPHVHFEILINGKQVDPLKYLN